MSTSNEIDADNLPSALLSTIHGLEESTKVLPLSLKSKPIGAADHYTYRITIKNGPKQRVVECTQYNLDDDLTSLIRYVEKRSRKG